MKVPIEWIKDFIEIPNSITPEKLAEEISLKAFEVEKVEYSGVQITGPLLSGKIVEITKHPNADKLQVTKVITSEKEKQQLRQIVCGAKNIEVGQIVPVALPGATVNNRKTNEALPIKVGKIRDVESCGMLCSADELGFESDVDGIHILPSDTKIGLDLIEGLKLEPEAILDIESRSNRGDALCLQGIAREIAATIDSDLKLDYYKQSEKRDSPKDQIKDQKQEKNIEDRIQTLIKQNSNAKESLKAEIADSKICSKVGFIKINGIKVSKSPEWLAKRLNLAGISSINNVVDVTNYVMLELGQPMHAYDASQINFDEAIRVDFPQKEANFKGLDEKDYKLGKNHLTICNGSNILGIAGVMGGEESSVKDSTTNIVLEAACFSFSHVRATSRSVGTFSESSRRFERGTDSELVEIALNRATKLIEELTGGKAEACVVEDLTEKDKDSKQELEVSLSNYQKIIGSEIEIERAVSTLEKLGFEILLPPNPNSHSSGRGNPIESKDTKLLVKIPSYRRRDIQREIDLIEELVRFQNLNEVDAKPLPGISKLLPAEDIKTSLKNSLLHQGYFEAISSSLVPQASIAEGSLIDGKSEINDVEMNNPLSQEHCKLRNSLMHNLLSALVYNSRRQNNTVKLFEFGKVYGFSKSLEDSTENNYQEVESLGLLLSTKTKDTNWQGQQQSSSDFFELKSLIELLCDSRGRLTFTPLSQNKDKRNKEESVNNSFHPNVSASIQFNGRDIGYLGMLHPNISKKLEVPKSTFVAELKIATLLKKPKSKAKKLNDTPTLQRDFTIDLQPISNLSHSSVEKKLQQAKLKDLQSVKLMSSFKAKGSETTSLSYRLIFQSDSGKLVGEEINKQIEKLKNGLVDEFVGVSLRDGE